ncbi:MAG: DNA repair protein RecO [Holosporaceae bacterium]|nr:MAG: DNA repair protein RecO [Holosporaceae bacterium]
MEYWSSHGIILARRVLGEKDALVFMLTEDRGICTGILKNFRAKKNQAIQVGNYVACHWKARLSEHLGMWSLEVLKSFFAEVILDAAKLRACTLVLEMVRNFLPEQHPYPFLYKKTLTFLEALSVDTNWAHLYVLFELHLLQEVGFGLKLKSCAVTDSREMLSYVSPKTGCAVSQEVGAPYAEKLFPLPSFFS